MNSNHHLPAALIFDMDGVLVQSNPFHLEKWADVLSKHQIAFDPEALPRQVFGHHNHELFRTFFGEHLTTEEILPLEDELEEDFRRVFEPHAKPLPGLERLVFAAHQAGIPMAVASSALAKNVNFIVDTLNFRPYFQSLTTGDEVKNAKPDPEIYLKAAAKLGVNPSSCVAFEDSYPGIEAAKRARMKCVGIASTYPVEDLQSLTHADRVVADFRAVTLEGLRQLFIGAG